MSRIKGNYLKKEIYTSINSEITKRFVDAGLEIIRACINCGTCSGSCPSGSRTALRTRSLIRRALIGDKSVLNDINLWLCSTCYTCYERCPRALPITDILLKLRNIAVEKGEILDSHFNLCKLFYDSGHGVPINAADHQRWRDLRKSLGLAELPPTVHSLPKELEECQIIMKLNGFKKLLDKLRAQKEEEIMLA